MFRVERRSSRARKGNDHRGARCAENGQRALGRAAGRGCHGRLRAGRLRSGRPFATALMGWGRRFDEAQGRAGERLQSEEQQNECEGDPHVVQASSPGTRVKAPRLARQTMRPLELGLVNLSADVEIWLGTQ
jgi:hypothetical protein